MLQAQKDLRKLASPKKARFAQHFFRTGPGGYGEGDIFLGITVPDVRAVAKNYFHLTTKELSSILKSPLHEERLLALIILVTQYKKSGDFQIKKRIFNFYIKNRRGINNWDLVDTSAPSILGHYTLETKDSTAIWTLAKSKRHWDRRLAMVATFAHIRAGQLDLTWKLSAQFLDNKEDLMHKATGWMLREAGKRDPSGLRKFIDQYGQRMPRTMLRYSIEKFSATERKRILKSTK